MTGGLIVGLLPKNADRNGDPFLRSVARSDDTCRLVVTDLGLQADARSDSRRSYHGL